MFVMKYETQQVDHNLITQLKFVKGIAELSRTPMPCCSFIASHCSDVKFTGSNCFDVKPGDTQWFQLVFTLSSWVSLNLRLT